MQRLTANTILYGRILLKEELSAAAQPGQQVWAVQDQQTGQSLIARFHNDGRVEWFSDNRTPAVAAPEPPTPVPDFMPVTPTPVLTRLPVSSPSSPPTGKRTIWFLGIMVLLGGAIAGHFYRQPVLAYLQSFRAGVIARPDSARLDSAAQRIAHIPAVVSQPAVGVDWKSATATPSDSTTVMLDNRPTVSSDDSLASLSTAPITAQQATRLLNQLPHIPAEKHPAIFVDARQAFTTLRQTAGRQSYIDSLFTHFIGRGAQSLLTYQQNGDPVSKRYALDWYQTAYALKPDVGLAERIGRLKGEAPNQRPRPVRKSQKNDGSLFMNDPEVN